MRACLVFICLLAVTFALSVKNKHHGKHHRLRKASHATKEQDIVTEETNKPQLLPTLSPLEPTTHKQETQEQRSEGNANTNKEDGELEGTERGDESPAVLMSEEELVEVLRKEAEEEEEVERRELKEGEDEAHRSTLETARGDEYEEAEGEQKKREEEEVAHEEETMEESVVGKVEEEVEKVPQGDPMTSVAQLEETGSTESEIPGDVDYAADTEVLQPAEGKSHIDDTQYVLKTDVADVKEKEDSEKELLPVSDDYDQDVQNTEAADSDGDASDEERLQEDKESQAKRKDVSEDVDAPEAKGNTERDSGREGESAKMDGEGKTRKQKKNQRAKNRSPQREVAQPGPDQNQQEPQDSHNTVHKAKRRRAGKWGPLVGMNPVQIRSTVELYPSSRPSPGGGTHDPEAPADPCEDFHCKRGKMCKLDADNKPGCVCQEASACPPSVNEFEHVCGTDNRTYDTSCQLFATKCSLEGTKKGHRLHLDYTGPCKLIPACVDTELVQFPLRMRDWLKNVLLQLYEHDSASPGYLTPKQRFRVTKIFESERRLHAGDHPVELLAQDFEKNYNMYIYPVHWQFAQLDQHPSDRLLSHSELAPLRVPLVPMEHCTSRFFQVCDADKDKQVSFKEWTSCFGIKHEDMDVNLLF
ncbi:SPARC-like protein 1 [Betta splendens]|uniref:SPARC-like protein 1 n=1 Tax=Betta splendens TaxID=158456 RepID=A0A6P7NA49_BETSP|nr:SPARC-like protein 1 [Betta splendens]